MTTGWPPGLLQDDSRELSRWLSNRLDARYIIRKNLMNCHYCHTTTKELRPYGPRGAMVCFDCGTSSEHVEETNKNFAAQLEAAGPIAVIGTEAGPYPLEGTRS